jgi:hypothetical protein
MSAASEALLLTRLADALNACAEAGLHVKLKHSAAYTRGGYVLPVEDGRWVARTLLYTELSPPDDDPDDE